MPVLSEPGQWHATDSGAILSQYTRRMKLDSYATSN